MKSTVTIVHDKKNKHMFPHNEIHIDQSSKGDFTSKLSKDTIVNCTKMYQLSQLSPDLGYWIEDHQGECACPR